MTISYKKFNTLILMLMASAYAQAMDTSDKQAATQELVKTVEKAYLACQATQGDLATIKHHLQNGADANAESTCIGSSRPLLCLASSQNGFCSIVKLLLDHGALVDIGTPLAEALEIRDINTAALLLTRKADLQKIGPDKSLKLAVEGGGMQPSKLALTALLLRHPHTQTHDIASAYSDLDKEENFEERTTLDKARWLTYHADTKERYIRILEAISLDQDTAGVIAQYAGCFHPVRKLSLEIPKKEKDKKLLAMITAIIPTSEVINKAALGTES